MEEKKIKINVDKVSVNSLRFNDTRYIISFSMTNIKNKFSLAIENSTDILSIGLLNKKKIINVKYYNASDQFNEKDDMFLNINNFVKETKLDLDDIYSLYVGCGPGSFTNIRKLLTFARGLRISIKNFKRKKKLFSLGINSLSAFAYEYFLDVNSFRAKFVLPTIATNCGDYYAQLFSQEKNLNNSINAVSPIVCLTPEKFESFLSKYTNDNKDTIILGLETLKLKNFKLISKNLNRPSALFIAKIGLEIEKQEKDTKKLIIDKNLYNIDFLPIYAKKPNIRKK